MAEGSDSSEGETAESASEGEREAEIEGETKEKEVDYEEDIPRADTENVDLDRLLEEKIYEKDSTEDQKEELSDLMQKCGVRAEDLPIFLRTIIYAGKNIFNFLFKKDYVDRCIKNADLKGKKVIVALHGALQTYWSSWTDFIEYCQGTDYIIIPIPTKNPEQITNTIRELTGKIGGKIDRVVAHSRGGKYALDAVLDHGLGGLIQELIISGTPIQYQDVNLSPSKGLIRPEYAEVGKKVRLINIYGSNDYILPFFGHANYGNLPNAVNLEFRMGHLDLLHNPLILDRYLNNYKTS